MSLEPGQTLGPYQIISPSGAGGMGEVYKAKDTRLDRIVAIKILPEKMRSQPQLVARFEQEAKAISRLNHPNICTLYDVGHEGGTHFLVMEYLEGESLSERLKRGALPAPEALEISALIADALDSAHGKKLIHRDLKPGNVMLTKEGPKLLDFGLAKLEHGDGVVDGVSGVTRQTPLTGEGTIIGTIQYMSPEQLEGKEADERSDIFAFGSTVYEMITGQKAFNGASQASLIAAILERNPEPVSQIKPMTPPGLDRLVKKCLEKDPDRRWQSVRDLADELRWISRSGSQAGTPVTVTRRRRIRFRLAWSVAAVALLIAAVFASLWFTHPKPEPRIRRVVMDLSTQFETADLPRISPDGRYLVFKGTDTSGARGLWLRPMSSLTPTLLPGTQNARRPFWSPDSRYFAFRDNDDQLKKMPVAGGPAQLIGEINAVADGSWGNGGIILVDGSGGDSLRQISAIGGVATAATTLNHEAGEVYHAWPEFLPDGRHFLYLTSTDSNESHQQYMLKAGELGSSDTKEFFTVGSRIEYCTLGYIVYVRDEILLAHPFDPDALEFTGEPIPIATGVKISSTFGAANFSVSNEGTLIVSRGSAYTPSKLVWVDRNGAELGNEGEEDAYGDIVLSPDGERLAFTILDTERQTYDLWVRDLQRKVSSRLTFSPLQELLPIWDNTGGRLIYTSGSPPSTDIRRKLADGGGEEENLLEGTGTSVFAMDVMPNDSRLCIGIFKNNVTNIYLADLEKEDDPLPLVESQFWDFGARVSPDGNYLAYASIESGRPEIYIRKIDDSGGRWQVSKEGGAQLQWRADGKELFYQTTDGVIMAVPIELGSTLRLGAAKKLFSYNPISREFQNFSFSASADGQRFLLNETGKDIREAGFIMVQDWQKEIERK